MSEKCRNNNSDNPLTSRRTDGGKNITMFEPKRSIYGSSTVEAMKVMYVDCIFYLATDVVICERSRTYLCVTF